MQRQFILALMFYAAFATGFSPAAQAQISGDAVIIGVLNDRSSVFADVTGEGSAIAARLAVEDYGGKVLGKRIEVVSADHQNKPDIVGSVAGRWMDVDGVDAILDGGSSAAGLLIQKMAQDRGKIAILSGPATSDLTGKACSPTGFHWTYDTYALGSGTARALIAQGANTWFFVTSDYAFGHALERDATRFITESGGKVVGGVRHPLNNPDFSSFLLQAQSSKAKIIGLANSGDDALNAVKQAAEFGIVQSGQRLGGLLLLINQIHGLGLKAAQGVIVSEAFYWDQSEQTRAFTARFEALARKKPNMLQAGVYSATMHFLKAVEKSGTDDGVKVADAMRALPVNDFMSKDVVVRADGRVMRNMYLFEVKSPAESKAPWDYYKQIGVIPGDKAFRPAAESECPLLKKS
ncbi:ABC transporter substrate-binding protein [Ferrovibrio sp.]|uniref:ABC transporter substrate-binding protein n=1 Tax=Ferrovibrio sp. TaxID=1917215 RepID=UPI003D298F82